MAESDIKRTGGDNSIVAVVVTYNRKILLRECLKALIAQNVKDFKILVVDNSSTDGTREFISNLIDEERVFYINTGKNLGGAGGFNFGIKEAVKMHCDYIWLMDDDCIVHDGSLFALLDYSQKIKGQFGFLSSAVMWTDGSICRMNVQRKSISRTVGDFNKSQKIMLASFVSLFLNVNAVRECGLPIKEFFIWGDDWEYTARISKKFKNYFVPESIVTHKTQNSAGVDIVSANGDELNRYFYAYRNEKYFYSHLGLKGEIYHFAKIVYHRLKLLMSNIPDKGARLAIMKKGLRASKNFNPPIEFVEMNNR